MDITLNQFVFFVLAILIVVFSVMTVTAKTLLRSATYLLFVLFATAGIYFQLNYEFLGAVQLMVYAGGIVVLYVFSILLTSSDKEKLEGIFTRKGMAALVASLAGLGLTLFIILTNDFLPSKFDPESSVNMKEVGHALVGAEKFQYVLPFEVISILLLACIIGGILIARKR